MCSNTTAAQPSAPPAGAAPDQQAGDAETLPDIPDDAPDQEVAAPLEAPGYSVHECCIAEGDDILVKTVTLEEALTMAALSKCRGFTFMGPLVDGRARIFFKTAGGFKVCPKSGWTTYCKDVPQCVEAQTSRPVESTPCNGSAKARRFSIGRKKSQSRGQSLAAPAKPKIETRPSGSSGSTKSHKNSFRGWKIMDILSSSSHARSPRDLLSGRSLLDLLTGTTKVPQRGALLDSEFEPITPFTDAETSPARELTVPGCGSPARELTVGCGSPGHRRESWDADRPGEDLQSAQM